MKEQAVISYNKGISNTPSDFICDDGMLAECVNMEVKDNELIPVQMPIKLSVAMNDGELLLKIHNIPNSEVKNYVYNKIINGKTYLSIFYIVNGYRVDYNFGGNTLASGSEVPVEDVRSVETLGNTVIVFDKNNIHYFLYVDGSYKYLGNELPKVNISFNLTGTFDIDNDGTHNATYRLGDDPKENYKIQREAIQAGANKLIEEKGFSQNKFVFPFFVRYALRLANGEHVCHSAPILMRPCMRYAPYYTTKEISDKDGYRTEVYAFGSYFANLQYRINDIGNLNDWSDVVKGVDIFVSKQIYSYDQSYSGISYSTSGDYYIYGAITKVDNFTTSWASTAAPGQSHTRTELRSIYKYNNQSQRKVFSSLRPISEDKFITNLVEGSSVLYRYYSIPSIYLDKSDDYITIDSSDGAASPLSTIEQNETLVDDYMTNDKLIPLYTSVYNGRMNIANIKRLFFAGFKSESMLQPLDESVSIASTYTTYVYIRGINGDVVVKSKGIKQHVMYGGFFFYPDTDAYKMVIVDNKDYKVTIPLNEHPGLNGAYAFVDNLSFSSGGSVMESEEPYEYMHNKLCTSDVNNPFYFPLAGINTIGNDDILGLSAMTRPISQGQFGQYPLIAFCSDGNYALKVDANGYYSGVSPIQEDIVIGDSKITSLEDSIVIVTQRGLMLTTGGVINKLASQMDGASFDSTTLEGIASWDEEFKSMLTSSVSRESFISYLYGAKIAYDYSLNRLFIYNPKRAYSYIYNFDNHSVTKVVFKGYARSINSVLDYPDTIIQNSDGSLYSLYQKEDVSSKTDHQKGLIITRALKFGSMMDLKSIFRIKNIHSGFDSDSYVKCSIYGSNDGVNYYLSASRFGKPYKFYRMVIYTNLLPKETLSGTVFEFEKRRTNKLR